MTNKFNCKNCNFEEKTPKTDFCKICNSLQNEILRFNKQLKSITNSNNKLKKYLAKSLFQKRYKTQYLLKLRKGLNQKIKISSMDLEHLFNDVEVLLKRSPKITTTHHCVNQFHPLSQKYKSFLYVSLSNVLFDSVKNIYPNTFWFLLRTDCPWED
ncbi:MAG: hypothetical protein WC609_00460 [Candidatus Paceibacterota bacterium]|jgi:hypothetical protein